MHINKATYTHTHTHTRTITQERAKEISWIWHRHALIQFARSRSVCVCVGHLMPKCEMGKRKIGMHLTMFGCEYCLSVLHFQFNWQYDSKNGILKKVNPISRCIVVWFTHQFCYKFSVFRSNNRMKQREWRWCQWTEQSKHSPMWRRERQTCTTIIYTITKKKRASTSTVAAAATSRIQIKQMEIKCWIQF